jgi:hypothetical protein
MFHRFRAENPLRPGNGSVRGTGTKPAELCQRAAAAEAILRNAARKGRLPRTDAW